MQTNLRKFLKLSSSDEGSSDDPYVSSDEEEKKSKASDWTRIKGRDQFTVKYPRVFKFSDDLKALLREKITSVSPDNMKQLVFFDPDSYRGSD